MSRRNGRQAVYIVLVGGDFVPQRPWDFPPAFTSGELYVKNVSMDHAHGFVRSYNKRAVQQREQGTWDRKWALAVKHVRCVQQGKYPRSAKVEGGAA